MDPSLLLMAVLFLVAVLAIMPFVAIALLFRATDGYRRQALRLTDAVIRLATTRISHVQHTSSTRENQHGYDLSVERDDRDRRINRMYDEPTRLGPDIGSDADGLTEEETRRALASDPLDKADILADDPEAWGVLKDVRPRRKESPPPRSGSPGRAGAVSPPPITGEA